MTETVRNGDLHRMKRGLKALSDLGSKDPVIVKRLAKMIRLTDQGLIELEHAQMALVKGHAKVEHGSIVLNEDRTAPVFENVVEYNLADHDLLYQEVSLDAVPPFAEADLKKFKTFPDSETLALCGVFVSLD